MTKTVRAPFTTQQVKNLKDYQKRGDRHPFTCRGQYCDRSQRKDEGILIPTTEGMVCPCGKYTQDWVHQFMVEKQPSKGFFTLRIPLAIAAFEITVKWKHTFYNILKPWFGVSITPLNKKMPKNEH